MSARIRIRGIKRWERTSAEFQRLLPRAVSQGARKGLSKAATQVRRELRGLPLGRAITRSPWGKKKRNRLTARVKALKLRRGGSFLQGRLTFALGMYGYAALLEEGGRIVQHTIYSRGRTVSHPGADVAGHGVGRRAFEGHTSTIGAEVDVAIGKLIRKVEASG